MQHEYSKNIGQASDDGTTCERGRSQIPSESMLSAVDSPARTLVPATIAERGSMGSAAAYGLNMPELFGSFDLDTSSLRMSQRLLFADLNECSVALPRAGTMRNGKLFRRRCWARRMKETGFSLWPTPQASDGKRMEFSREAHLKHQARNRLIGWGTGPAGLNVVAHCQIEFDGCPTANFVEWLMGFPMNWTAIEG